MGDIAVQFKEVLLLNLAVDGLVLFPPMITKVG